MMPKCFAVLVALYGKVLIWINFKFNVMIWLDICTNTRLLWIALKSILFLLMHKKLSFTPSMSQPTEKILCTKSAYCYIKKRTNILKRYNTHTFNLIRRLVKKDIMTNWYKVRNVVCFHQHLMLKIYEV